MKLPRLQLSLGQVAWALSDGQPAPKHLRDQLNYLRQLGIPFAKEDRQPGSGNRVDYGFEDLVECGVALYAFNNGMKPADISAVLVGDRANMRKIYRKALRDQPEGALTQPWLKSRGMSGALLANEIYLRLHDRYSTSPGKVEMLGPNDRETPAGAPMFDMVEHSVGKTVRLVPLTVLAMKWTAWALEAPEIKTGPRN